MHAFNNLLLLLWCNIFLRQYHRLAETENKMRGVQTDHSAVMALHEREMEALRAAQKNNLLIIENYQEENDLLRSAVRP